MDPPLFKEGQTHKNPSKSESENQISPLKNSALPSAISKLSGSSRGIPCNKDFHFYFNFPEFKDPVEEMAQKSQSLLETIGSSADKIWANKNMRFPNVNDEIDDEAYDWLVNLNDELFERFDTSVDEFKIIRDKEEENGVRVMNSVDNDDDGFRLVQGKKKKDLLVKNSNAVDTSSSGGDMASGNLSSSVKVASRDGNAMGTPKAKVPFHIASIRRPQDEYKILVNNSNQPFDHVWLEKSEDGSRVIHPLEKLSVMNFIDKTIGDVEPVKPAPVESTSFKHVKDVKDLKELAAKLRDASEFAVDLEHNQYRSFQGLTCLMQISTRTEVFIVDTLKLWFLIGPYLQDVFKDPTKRKVMHGADQKILWLQRDFGIYVCNMLDIGQASKVLKLENNSLEFLLQYFCGVAADKEYQNSDWRLRPLLDEMLRYARENTQYLLYINDLMKRRLLSSSTDPEFPEAPLVEVYQRSADICMQLYEKEIMSETSYLSIDGLHSADLSAQQLAVVAGLCGWRDDVARNEDESTGFILPNKFLIEIAKQMPVTAAELCHLLKSRHPYIERHLGAVIGIISRSMQNATAFEPVVKKLKEEYIEMIQKKPSGALGAIFGNPSGKRKFNPKSTATEELNVEQSESSVALPFRSFTGRTEPTLPTPSPSFPNHHTIKIPVGDRFITVETGEIGRQASGSVIVQDGETIIYTSVCMSGIPSEPSDVFPMSVDYLERFSAAGRTSGGYVKREGKMKDNEVLVSRQIDRSLRPTMLKGFCHKTQIISLVSSYDDLHPPDSLAVTAAGIAVALSEVPSTNTIAGVRIGLIGDKFIVNPTTKEMGDSKLDLLMAASEKGIVMIEGYCEEFLPEEKLLQAIEVGQVAVRAICKEVDNLLNKCGKPKMLDKLPPHELYKHVEEIAGDELVKVLQLESKTESTEALLLLEKKVLSKLTEVGYIPAPMIYSSADVKLVFKRVTSKYWRKRIVEGGKRNDGRTSEEIRVIASRCGSSPRSHGSAVFTRGGTQAMVAVTLGDNQMAQRTDTLAGGEDVKRFYLQYSFLPSCVGQVGQIGPPSRREIGHGILAERALKPVLPSEEDFPYTIRVESTITESNGSSSMASVCGGCLALQDAGVPLKSSIAGIAMGLIVDTEEFGGDGAPLILSDITGFEDAYGDMDFKVAGNEDGITAFQMDIKVTGITLTTVKQALMKAKEGRKHILAEMLKCSTPPSKKLSEHAPLIHVMKVKPEKVNLIIGSGGKTVKRIIKETGVDFIDTQEDGIVKITARDQASLEMTKTMISNLTKGDGPNGFMYLGPV